ncbi:cadherin-related family member 4 isoform X8 [Manis pentadactyla]|uniref:cadherin-related family member 4 isoform X8 n=1 Tax=Manis pentadactyla TaxID=143292 RepID=UPI00255CD56E|nr:cadherin-related family member 4 isoform X8 [Manis pentadactyla]
MVPRAGGLGVPGEASLEEGGGPQGTLGHSTACRGRGGGSSKEWGRRSWKGEDSERVWWALRTPGEQVPSAAWEARVGKDLMNTAVCPRLWTPSVRQLCGQRGQPDYWLEAVGGEIWRQQVQTSLDLALQRSRRRSSQKCSSVNVTDCAAASQKAHLPQEPTHCPSNICCLPWFVNVSESQGPGTVLESFSFNCSSHVPTLELLHVQPPTTFFNPPSLTRWQGIYVGMVTLSSSARLDALAVNHYELRLRFTCGTHVMEGPLSVDVQRDSGRIQCAGRFASPAGEVIQVPETVQPGAQLYTLLLPGLELRGAQVSITSAQDPAHFPGPFSIDGQGWLRAPPQGLKGQAPKAFQLHIVVTFGQNRSCHGVLRVDVLPVPSSQVSFLEQAQNITIPENLAPGSKVAQVHAQGSDVRYEILSPAPCPLFSIGRDDGVVRSTAPLELAQAPGTAVTRLQVKAYERLRPWASVEQDLTVNVRSVNRWPPRCLPALLVTQIPETTPVGTVLTTFTCTDPDSPGSALDFQLLSHSPPGPASLCLRNRVLEVPSPFPVPLLHAWDKKGGRLRVNATLDCDTPGVCFQHVASILVLDGGQPLMTTEVPVLVTVTPVNEFSPACAPRTFHVREDAGPHTLLGSVVGTDADYPHDSAEYYVSGRPAVFAVDRLSGEVRLLGRLDYELQRWYRLAVLLADHSQDQDPTHRRSGSCTITIEVEDVNDHAPECEPPLQELIVHAPLGRRMEVTNLSCWVPQEPQRLAFSYSIVAGNSQSRFRLQGAALVHSEATVGPPWPNQPHTQELLIRVADAGPSIPRLSTTATVIVHLVPWRASTEATSTHRATVPSGVTPLLVTDTEAFWQPEPWFVVVLTVTGALLLAALGWLLSRPLQGLAQVIQAPSKPAQCLLPNSTQGTQGSMEGFVAAPRMQMPQQPSSVRSLQHFDGRAQDSREYPLPNHSPPGPTFSPFPTSVSPPTTNPLSDLSLNGVCPQPSSPLSQCLSSTCRTRR